MADDRGETFAFEIIRRVTGVEVEPYDQPGQQRGAVDGLIRTAGRTEAVEVTRLVDQKAQQLDAILYRNGQNAWPNPGRWRWSISLASAAEYPGMRERYERIIGYCEEHGVTDPTRAGMVSPIPEIKWLWNTSARFYAYGDDSHENPTPVHVWPRAIAGAVDHSFAGLRQALADTFDERHMPDHLDKLLAHPADARHLALLLGWTGLPLALYDAIVFGDQLPTDPPPLPDGITHLWLIPDFGKRVLLWSPDGWAEHHVFDPKPLTD